MNFVIEEKGDIFILRMQGELRLTEAPPLSITIQKLVKEQLELGKTKFILDFKRVDFIDSYGIGDLVASYVSAQNKGAKLKIANLSLKVGLVLNYCGIPKIIEIFDDEEAAIKSFR
jgi:anti-sigma B factor antagonist